MKRKQKPLDGKKIGLCAIVAALLSACNTFAEPPVKEGPSKSECTQGTDLEPSICPLELPEIESLHVDYAGRSSEQPPDEPDCNLFVPTTEDIKKYLQAAGSVSEWAWDHLLAWTECRSYGSGVFSDGARFRWHVRPTGIGRIDLEDGSKIHIYCPDCDFKPFWVPGTPVAGHRDK